MTGVSGTVIGQIEEANFIYDDVSEGTNVIEDTDLVVTKENHFQGTNQKGPVTMREDGLKD